MKCSKFLGSIFSSEVKLTTSKGLDCQKVVAKLVSTLEKLPFQKIKRQDAKRNYADNGTAMGSRKSVPTFPSSNALGEGAFGMQPQTWQA